MKETEYVTSCQWESYARRIENKNLKETGTSLTATGIARRAYSHIIETDRGIMLVKKGWREAMEEKKEVYCHACSVVGGAGRAIYHAPPICSYNWE